MPLIINCRNSPEYEYYSPIGASIDQVRQAFFEADLEMTVGVVVEVVL